MISHNITYKLFQEIYAKLLTGESPPEDILSTYNLTISQWKTIHTLFDSNNKLTWF